MWCSVTTKKGGIGGVEVRFKREGVYVYLWLTDVVLWQKPTKYCKAVILQLKTKILKVPRS